jgi:hypothetical protein
MTERPTERELVALQAHVWATMGLVDLEIADRLGVSVSTARRRRMEGAALVPARTNGELVALMLARQEAATRTAFTIMSDDRMDADVRLKAAQVILKAGAETRKMHGVDMPSRVVLETEDSPALRALDAMVAEAVRAVPAERVALTERQEPAL